MSSEDRPKLAIGRPAEPLRRAVSPALAFPLRVWFLGVFFLARHKKGISARQFQRDTGVGNYQTAWTLLHKRRSGLATQSALRLKGAVEADET